MTRRQDLATVGLAETLAFRLPAIDCEPGSGHGIEKRCDRDVGTVIATSQLFRPLSAELLALLGRLAPAEWDLSTSAAEWTVRDVAAHLLDVDLRRLSVQRDAHILPPTTEIASDRDLVAYLNHLNRTWVSAARRLSSRILLELLEVSSAGVADLVETADPSAPATFPVAWAGEALSAMWFDIAREFTERWHHQDQIRAATGAAPLAEPRWLRPVLETSLCALPHAFRDVAAPAGTCVLLRIDGGAGGDWTLRRERAWTVHAGSPAAPPATTVMASDLALSRLLLHRLTGAEAERLVRIEGDRAYAAPLLQARAVMV